MGNQQYMEGD